MPHANTATNAAQGLNPSVSSRLLGKQRDGRAEM
jgi:hypothetical protein